MLEMTIVVRKKLKKTKITNYNATSHGMLQKKGENYSKLIAAGNDDRGRIERENGKRFIFEHSVCDVCGGDRSTKLVCAALTHR